MRKRRTDPDHVRDLIAAARRVRQNVTEDVLVDAPTGDEEADRIARKRCERAISALDALNRALAVIEGA